MLIAYKNMQSELQLCHCVGHCYCVALGLEFPVVAAFADVVDNGDAIYDGCDSMWTDLTRRSLFAFVYLRVRRHRFLRPGASDVGPNLPYICHFQHPNSTDLTAPSPGQPAQNFEWMQIAWMLF